MPPMGAIQSARLRVAETLEMENTFGTLEQGKAADVIAVCGYPLQHTIVLQQVASVTQDGIVQTSPK